MCFSFQNRPFSLRMPVCSKELFASFCINSSVLGCTSIWCAYDIFNLRSYSDCLEKQIDRCPSSPRPRYLSRGYRGVDDAESVPVSLQETKKSGERRQLFFVKPMGVLWSWVEVSCGWFMNNEVLKLILIWPLNIDVAVYVQRFCWNANW